MKDKQEVDMFEKSEKQLHVFLKEIGELSKKKPNDAVNKFKLGLINTLLSELNGILGGNKPFSDFASFDPDQLPTNSDVRVILAQYAAAVHRHRTQNTFHGGSGNWYWTIKGKRSGIETNSPHKFEPPE